MNEAVAIAAIERLRAEVHAYLLRLDDLFELIDARIGAIENRMAKIDRGPDAGGSRLTALRSVNRQRKNRCRPRCGGATARIGERAIGTPAELSRYAYPSHWTTRRER
jgi:hypothetical protein